MSSVRCAVKGCQRRREASEGVFFHTLPASAARKRVWEEAIGCSSLPYSARVCSAHFLDSDYLPQCGNRRLVNRLRWTAVPSVDLPTSGNVVVVIVHFRCVATRDSFCFRLLAKTADVRVRPEEVAVCMSAA
uniref:THAP-type domain-containing protein n=1 Tax=Rhipicephalus appendiculatus TaxID=34631 RepID=A0A131YHE8_RHIAP